MTNTADTIHAAYYPIYKARFSEFPKSLQDELSRLAGVVKVGGVVSGSIETWVADGWKLYKAASLGLQPASQRKMMMGPLESQVFIGNRSVCVEVQKAFINSVVPAAKGLALTGLPKDLRDYLAG